MYEYKCDKLYSQPTAREGERLASLKLHSALPLEGLDTRIKGR